MSHAASRSEADSFAVAPALRLFSMPLFFLASKMAINLHLAPNGNDRGISERVE